MGNAAESSSVTGLKRVLIVGGGTSGYFAALAFKKRFPELTVTLLESDKIPIIGVGEATTPLMPTFLHHTLGIDIVELYEKVRPTWKLGIKFEWGLPGEYSFLYPFGSCSPVEAFAQDGAIANSSICAQMMHANTTPILRQPDGTDESLLPHMKFAYHLDNKRFVRFLAEFAVRQGIEHVVGEVAGVDTDPTRTNVHCLHLADGRTLDADFYIDSTGFRSLILSGALQSPFRDFKGTLLCDSAVVGEVPQTGPIRPYTTAETMDNGWCWRIPVEGEDHRGYVFSSAFTNVEKATEEMARKNPGLTRVWNLKFRSGRHTDFWKGNVAGVGNAYGFVEPLESTALHMVIIELGTLLDALALGPAAQAERTRVNADIGGHWDFLRWFLGVHYKFNRRLHTPFWRAARADVDVSGVQPFLDLYHAHGPWEESAAWGDLPRDPTFNHHGMLVLLLGQHAPCPRPNRTALTPDAWSKHVEELTAVSRRALGQADALQVLRARPELLRALTDPARPTWMSDARLRFTEPDLADTRTAAAQHLFDGIPVPPAHGVSRRTSALA